MCHLRETENRESLSQGIHEYPFKNWFIPLIKFLRVSSLNYNVIFYDIQIKFMLKTQMIFILIGDSAFLAESLKLHP